MCLFTQDLGKIFFNENIERKQTTEAFLNENLFSQFLIRDDN